MILNVECDALFVTKPLGAVVGEYLVRFVRVGVDDFSFVGVILHRQAPILGAYVDVLAHSAKEQELLVSEAVLQRSDDFFVRIFWLRVHKPDEQLFLACFHVVYKSICCFQCTGNKAKVSYVDQFALSSNGARVSALHGRCDRFGDLLQKSLRGK
jgi:hypothetical protein